MPRYLIMTNDEDIPDPATEESPVVGPPLYRDRRTASFAEGEREREFQSFERQAKKRLLILTGAVSRNGLKQLPSNHFEALGGKRAGQYSIRVNLQWRICFEWPDDAPRPCNIEIVDYH